MRSCLFTMATWLLACLHFANTAHGNVQQYSYHIQYRAQNFAKYSFSQIKICLLFFYNPHVKEVCIIIGQTITYYSPGKDFTIFEY